jgi:hypothetical protein
MRHHANKKSVILMGLILLLCLSVNAADSPTNAAPNNAEKGEARKVVRNYEEEDLVTIYTGRTAKPQYQLLEEEIAERIRQVTEKKVFFSIFGMLGKFSSKDGFDHGKVVFEDKDVFIEVGVYCGARIVEGRAVWVKFGEAENYLFSKLFLPPKDGDKLAAGSFTGKSLGELAWHFADDKTGEYQMAWLRGVTIVSIRMKLKSDTDIKKDAKEKLDAAAFNLDAWIKERMFQYNREPK